MAYADYEFYTTEYGGKAVGADDFPALANMASAYINAATMNRAKDATGETLEAVKMVNCVLAEIAQDEVHMNANAFSAGPILTGKSVGSESKSYSIKSVSSTDIDLLDKRKRDALELYLGWTGLLRANGYYAKGCW